VSKIKTGDKVQECQWFLGCRQVATTTMPHAILGDVPICDRCKKKVERLDKLETHKR